MKPEITTTIDSAAVSTPKKSFILSFSEILRDYSSKAKASITKVRNKTPKIKLPKFVIFIVIAAIVVGGIILFVKSTQTQTNQNLSAVKPLAPTAKSTFEINKEFDFPIKDSDGKTISTIKYIVESASIQDEILVKGERARAVQGRTFLIINLKIKNTYKQGIQINSRDYVRLVLDGNKEELIAADIHNDPVEVQAISTKTTRIGFPINEIHKSLELQVGEINGKKETIQIKFS